MRAIILAAGRGTRISKKINNIPKSMLQVGEQPLLAHTVRLLTQNDIDVTVIVGYRQEEIKKALEGLDVEYYYNPFYDVTNSIASLWFAKEIINQDCIIANADVFWTQELLNQILECDKEVFMLADTSKVIEGDYFLYVEEDKVKKYGKELELHERNCEYVGISCIRGRYTKIFAQKLEELIRTQQHSKWWEDVLYSLTNEINIQILDINGIFWAEIDYIDDYEKILEYIKRV